MDSKMLKYEFNTEEVASLLRVLDGVQVSKIQNMKGALALVEKLQNPLNKSELVEKQELENLKALKEKYEKK